MELPHLGKNCALRECNRLDFLPVKCDGCSEVFCIDHYSYDGHKCHKAKNRDNQVPVCPMCSHPVPSRPGQLPDVTVSEHIDRYCKGNESIKNKVAKAHTNLQACQHRLCKQKDVIYLECSDCRQKFCIKHRSPQDHGCPGPSRLTNLVDNWQSFKDNCNQNANSGLSIIKNKAHEISKSGQAAFNRITKSRGPLPSSSSAALNHRDLQGGISEEDALRIALNESSSKPAATTESMRQEEEDLALARAIQQSELEANGQRLINNGARRENCMII